uniref:Uncharacterized protein n=1 Tax=Rhipicephalus zambeziensis TaxID=60191 RepID=A0A224YE15_9ACAR
MLHYLFLLHMPKHCSSSELIQALLFFVPRLCLYLISNRKVIKDSDNSMFLMKLFDVFWCSIANLQDGWLLLFTGSGIYKVMLISQLGYQSK